MSTTLTNAPPRATIDDLCRVEGKAELIGGRIVLQMPTNFESNQVAGNIYAGLREYVKRSGSGSACMDNLGYRVPELASGRETFAPDVSYLAGSKPQNRRQFVSGPPTFAVEVRSEEDYGGPAVEAKLAAKRDDYFEAGTLVVWDVDWDAECVRVFRPESAQPELFTRGQTVDAEPAVPGWRMTVDEILDT